jgi:hypothetical protein
VHTEVLLKIKLGRAHENRRLTRGGSLWCEVAAVAQRDGQTEWQSVQACGVAA